MLESVADYFGVASVSAIRGAAVSAIKAKSWTAAAKALISIFGAKVTAGAPAGTLAYYAGGAHCKMNNKKFKTFFIHMPISWIFGTLIWGIFVKNSDIYFIAEYLSMLSIYYLGLSIYSQKNKN